MLQILLVLLGLTTVSCASSPNSDEIFKRWASYKTPSEGTSEAIGSYSAGCLAGSESLDMKGKGFVVMRPSRSRFHGHKSLVAFLNTYSKKVYDKYQKVIPIGDLSQIRGGPMKSGHRSHQSGLDVDIWFTLLSLKDVESWNSKKAEELQPLEVTDPDFKTLKKSWTEERTNILKMAAQDERVERIFVNARIKEHLCGLKKREPWMKKIRPWWAHHDHFHVRLKCPALSTYCTPQTAPNSYECDDKLAWWFSEEAYEKFSQVNVKKVAPTLPSRCNSI